MHAGSWEHPFKAEDTRPAPFQAIVKGSTPNTLTSTSVQVPMMTQDFLPEDKSIPTPTRPRVALSEVPGKYRAVRLPYNDSPSLAAVFVLPDASLANITDAAREVSGEAVLKPEGWGPVSERLKLSLPKFEAKVDLQLREVSG